MSSAFIQAAVILLREGLEAMLVIAALAGYLTKAGAGHRIQALYGGSLAAVGASIIAAWLFAVLNSGEHSDVLEGIIILVAASLMLYVSGWLMVKQDPRGWQDYLAHKADSALAQDTVWAVAALAFLEDSAAAAVHHYLGIPVRDGDQIHWRSRAGIPASVDAAAHRTEKRGMARRHRIESERRGAVGAATGDRICAGDLFGGPAQQPARPRGQRR